VLRFRYIVRRFPLLYWMGALALVAVTGLAMARLVGNAQAAAARFGGLRSTVVAARPVPAGALVRPGDVTVRRLPAALVPRGPVAGVGAAVGHLALVAMAPGEVVLVSKVAPSGRRGVSALLSDGSEGLAVPVGPTTPPVTCGDHVDVLASFESDTAAAAGTAPTFPVARGAVVVAVDHQAVTVAVTPDEAPRLAYALTHGAVTLALTGP